MGLIENNIWHIPLKTVDYKYVFIFMHNEQNEKVRCNCNNESIPLTIVFKTHRFVNITYENVAIEHDIKCIDDI